ncbi:MAG: KamA family radical SAM protein [Clostridia bacterium]|nr:KamA family radical SAM protein [Clostridia bacterium]MBQ2434027.1 KamA family radical SAM protein [Clostridia bacterium]
MNSEENARFIHNAEQLLNVFPLTDEQKKEIDDVRRTYPMLIPPHYASLIGEAGSPVWKQCVPSMEELQNPGHFEDDPLHEGNFSPVPYLVHKYPDRAAFFICNTCYMYCRHCTRKNTVIKNERVTKEQFEDVIAYLKKTTQIRDVLITGGDPFTLSDETLNYFLTRLREIEHIQTLRIGTRAIVVKPDRITEKLADMLSKHHPLWINTHFNHPSEITPEAAKACDILLSRGIPLGNQTVLLKGVNDDIDTMEQLVLGLIRIRVRPYYLYQCDNVCGTSHFHTDYKLGMDIIQELRRRVSGYAVPRFVIDVPGPRGGKITTEYTNFISDQGDKLLLRAFDGGEVAFDKGGNR